MKGLRALKDKISPAAFTRFWWLIAAVWFLGIYPFLAWTAPEGWVGRMRMAPRAGETPMDFAQYYAGALAAANGWWDCLYPVPRSDVYDGPSSFEPVYKTFLWHHGPPFRPCDYPTVGMGWASDYRPRLAAACPQIADGSCHYFNPPPLALLLRPLAWVDFDTAAHKVWPVLSIAALFGMAFFSGRIFRLLAGRPGYAEGFVVASVVFFSFGRGISHVSSGNVGPILSFLIAFAAYAWMRGWQAATGTAMIPLLLFKGIGVFWCPLFVIKKVQWRILGTLALLTAVLNGAVLYFGGVELYRQFFGTVLPRVDIPLGIGIVPGIHYYFGAYPKGLYLAVKLAVLALIGYGFWRQPDRRMAIAAVLGGLMALFCLLNASVWLPYFPEYCFFPFLGWLAWECQVARGGWGMFVRRGVLTGLAVITGDWIVKGGLFVVLGPRSMDVYHSWVTLPFFSFILPVFVLAAALKRLLGRLPEGDKPSRA